MVVKNLIFYIDLVLNKHSRRMLSPNLRFGDAEGHGDRRLVYSFSIMSIVNTDCKAVGN